MEALSLLKYWRSSSNLSPTTTLRCPPTTVLSTLSDSDSDDFIDLDFTILTNPKHPHQHNSLFYKGPLLPTKSRTFPKTSDEAPRRSGDGGRRFVMDVYRTKIKPLYVKVSRRADGGEVGRRRLGKCRSASSVVAPAPARRRDDSLLVMEDGIQSAIAHCKRSFNGTRDSDSALARSKSDSYDERSACVEKRKQEFASD